jgi:hypothetical protein
MAAAIAALEVLAGEEMVAVIRLPRHPDAPKTRGDCEDGPRPCPWVSCRYHLAIRNHGPIEVEVVEDWDDGRPTCALDVADEGEHTLEEVGEYLDVSRVRVFQIEQMAIARARRKPHG